MSMDVTEAEHAKAASERLQNIVGALSEDYYDLYYVDLDTDEYLEYGASTGTGLRVLESRGADFFASARERANTLLYEKDRERFIEALDKEKMLESIRNHGTFIIQYRLLIDGQPTYINMKATCISGDDRHMIIGVSNVDAQIRDRMAAQWASEESKSYLRLRALNSNLIVLYYIDPQTGEYTEFGATREYEELGIAKQGGDFFQMTYKNSLHTVHPKDHEMFLSLVTKENILHAIEQDGVFLLDYRLLIGDLPTYIRMKAAMIKENGKQTLILGLLNEDAQIRREQEYERKLSAARNMANRDALTGVKNKHAYVDEERRINEQIEAGEDIEFAIVICDINNLKIVNDTKGHNEGGRYIREACSIICSIFKHSPIYRFGGDEFTAICRGHDYECLDELLERMNAANEKNREKDGVQIACGCARFKSDRSVEAVFERADRRMYEHKAELKA